MTDEERMRAEFENWFLENDGDTRKLKTVHGTKHYCSTLTEWKWIGWQACWKLCGGMK